MRRTARNRARGFSLLELLVALSIMSLSLGLLYQASTGALRSVGDLDIDQRAGLLAQSILDARDAVPEAGWNESGQAGELGWQVSSALYPTNVTSPATTVPALHEVRVAVRWEGRLGARRIELQTLLPQQRPPPPGPRP